MAGLTYFLEEVFNENIFDFFNNKNKSKPTDNSSNKKEIPNQEEAKTQKDEYDNIIKKHKSKLMPIIKNKLNSCKDVKIKKILKPLDPLHSDNNYGPERDYNDNWNYKYLLLYWDLWKGYEDARAAEYNEETSPLWNLYKEIRNSVQEYCNKNIPNSIVEDDGDWDTGFLVITFRYNGSFVNESTIYNPELI